VAEKIESSILEASRKAVAENEVDDPSQVTACFDGSWQKCGHPSLIDISATFFNKEEALSTEIMCKFFFSVCHTNLTSEHKCKRN
jgi:hypothetical protein